jgi:hypothetical protein
MTITRRSDETNLTQAFDRPRWPLTSLSAALLALPALLVGVLICLPAEADARVLDEKSANSALSAATAHPLGSWLGLLLVSVLYLLLIPVLLPFLHAITGRGRVLAILGYGLCSVGAIGLAMENAAVAVALRAAIDPQVAHDTAVSFTIALQREQGPFTPLLWAGLGMFAGPLLLVAAAVRSTSLHWWQGVLAAILVVGMPLSQPGVSGLVYLGVTVAAVAMLAALHARERADRGR